MAALIRLMEVGQGEAEEEGEWKTWHGKHYTLKADGGYQTVELHAKDGRGLILRRSDGQITGQLSPEDGERLGQLLAYNEGQRQVELCVPVLARYLKWLGRYRDENAHRLVEFDPTTRTLTYRSWANPEDFLVAQRTQGGWQYVEGKLTPEREKAIAVDFERTLRQRERERDRGFER